MTSKFIQLHFLTSYPATLLNRDDVGFAKRITFGGVSRTRVSSQCLKRHWRTFQGQHSLGELEVDMSIRSRATFERYVLQPLIEDGMDPAVAEAIVTEVMAAVLGESAKAKKAKKDKEKEEDGDEGPRARTGQVTVLGPAEVSFLLGECRAVASDVDDKKQVKKAVKARLGRDAKKNLAALKCAAGLDAALFGRMVTSDILARGDAAVHVAHALTVHPEEAESDYFSAVDDLLTGKGEEGAGSGHIGSTELTSGLFYGYVVVDVPLLVANLEGCSAKQWRDADRTVAASVVERLVHLIATVSPGAKLGSTAPYSYAHMVLAEVGAAQPRTLANAFLQPVRPQGAVLKHTYDALADFLGELDGMYGAPERRLSAMGAPQKLTTVTGDPAPLAALASWVGGQVTA